MKYLVLFLLFIGCVNGQTQKKFSPVYEQVTNDKCCSDRRPNGVCRHELIPGCSSKQAPMFMNEYLNADNCCEYWGADGMCHKELVKGCAADLLYQY